MFNYAFEFKALPDSTGPVQAFADLVIEDTLKVSGFKIMKNQKSGELWVSPPQEKSNKVGDDGKAVYFPKVWWIDTKTNEDDRRTKIEEEVYSAMIEAFEGSRATTARQGAAAAHAKRNAAPATEEAPKTAAKKAGRPPIWGA
jgi:hypothetical protein